MKSGNFLSVKAKTFPDFVTYRSAKETPQSYLQAINSDDSSKWQSAMQEGIKSFAENSTWVLVDRLQSENVVKCKWIFKFNELSTNEPKFKARLVAKGVLA